MGTPFVQPSAFVFTKLLYFLFIFLRLGERLLGSPCESSNESDKESMSERRRKPTASGKRRCDVGRQLLRVADIWGELNYLSSVCLLAPGKSYDILQFSMVRNVVQNLGGSG